MKHADRVYSLALCGALLLTGCTSTVTEYEPGSDGRYHKVEILAAPWLASRPKGRPPDEDLVHYAVSFEIMAKQELRGQKPFKAYPTWRASWHHEYQEIRRKYNGSPERTQEVVECAHYVLQRVGLPTYDP